MTEPDQQKKVKQKVYALSRPSRCYNCDTKLFPDTIVQLKHQDDDEREVLCPDCSGIGHLELLPSGNSKITKLVSKYSTELYTVMRWSDLWKCYERKGLLAQTAAIDKAEKELGFKLPERRSVASTIKTIS